MFCAGQWDIFLLSCLFLPWNFVKPMAMLGETGNCCGANAMEIGLRSDSCSDPSAIFYLSMAWDYLRCTEYFSTVKMDDGFGLPFLIITGPTCYV